MNTNDLMKRWRKYPHLIVADLTAVGACFGSGIATGAGAVSPAEGLAIAINAGVLHTLLDYAATQQKGWW
jgi:hypothetical protein